MNRADALDAVAADDHAFEDFAALFADDKAFALEALRRNRDAVLLPHLSERLRDDREVVLAQITSAAICGGCYLRNASPRLQRDREVLLAAAERDQFFLNEHPALCADREIVLAAMRGGNSMARVDSSLCADREVAMTAAEYSDWNAFLYMDLRDDPCVRLCAVHSLDADFVDALLTTLRMTVRECLCYMGTYRDAYEYVHTAPHFTADQVKSFFAASDRRSVESLTHEQCEQVATCLNTRGLDDACDLVDALQGWPVAASDDAERASSETWMRDVHARICTCMRRLQEIDEALPRIAAAIERKGQHRQKPDARHSKKRCEAWVARVEALAAELHEPQAAYAQLAHKRAYAEAFA
jgi:hypothetical protein